MTEFDFEAIFGEDYLYFYQAHLTEQRSDDEASEVLELLDLDPGSRVLDAPCGHGRIANRLASLGHRVVGVDVTERFLELARTDAASRGASSEFVHGDLRSLPVDGPFDAVVCWFTSFGYFDDQENKQVLAEFRRVLAPGGVLLIESPHHDGFVRHFTQAPDAHLIEVGDDVMIDQTSFNPDLSRIETQRTVIRDGVTRKSSFFVRLPTPPEWRAWLREVGFSNVDVTDRGGDALTLDSWRVAVRATV